MSLFKLNEEVVDEDAKTFAHNYWTRSIGASNALNYKRWNPIAQLVGLNPIGAAVGFALNSFNFIDKIDGNYFHSMYTVNDKLKKKLQQWCSKIKGSTFTGEILKKAHSLDLSSNNNKGLASKFAGKAGADFGDGMMTTATYFEIIPALSGKGSHILYFIFDGDSIRECKILTCNGDPDNDSNFKVINLSNWNTVKPEEYKK